jgi:hypothetical protein
MSINNILLSTEMLASLYPDSLVMQAGTGGPEQQARKPGQEPDSGTGKKAVSRPEGIYRYLGNNQRRISFIVHYPEAIFLPDDQLAFLTRMLAACHCSIADVSVLNMAHARMDIKKLISQLNPGMLFLCGVSPADLNWQGPEELFSITRFKEMTAILIPSLTTLSQKETPDLIPTKKKLWACLKILFNIQN